jgi:hypothetical protein
VSPCLTDWGKSCTQRVPQNVLTLSRKVDECKPLALGPKEYWSSSWNRFDFFIVMGSVMDLVGRCKLTLSNPR